MSNAVRELVRKAVRDSCSLGPSTDFEDDTHLLAEGIIDSLGVFGVMSELESALGLMLPPEEITAENFQSVEAMLAMVKRLNVTAVAQPEAAQ